MAAGDIQLTAQWGTADAANILVADVVSVEHLEPELSLTGFIV